MFGAMPELRAVLHPTDFSQGSHTAFVHALRLSLASRASFCVLHVDAPQEHSQWAEFPGVRETLARWGQLEPGAPSAAVAELGLAVKKLRVRSGDPVGAILKEAHHHEPDLLVMATHNREGFSRLVRGKVAEPVAREAGCPALLVPTHAGGFVQPEDGAVTLETVLVPVAADPSPTFTFQALARLLYGLPEGGVLRLLHVGKPGRRPTVRDPAIPGWTVEDVDAEGEVEGEILKAAADADLIAMATKGHDTLGDALFGSTAERVLRKASCPVLAVPARD